ncbi:MAG: LacI family DNA-binding transcriptional regulator [Vallitaleaceae bacterium]|nr:LacI family DNA-binding transcriptional regulator [Vallitaleaceae bacterium]
MVKIGDIAKATGYSVTTVSKALNNYTDISEKARASIIKMASEMGYIPNAQARGLVMRRSFTIGLMLDEILGLGIEHPFFSGLIQSFRDAIEEQGFDMIFISNQIAKGPIETYLDHCRQRNVDGVFILCTDPNDPGIKQLMNSDIPSVIFDVVTEKSNCVLSNHYQGAFDAVNYLVALGHKRIAHIYGTELTFAGAERKRAYQDAMNYHDLPVIEEYMINGGYFDFRYGKKAMEALLELTEPPTAVFAAGDIMALGAMKACYERHIRIPEDLSIIGFDNVKMLEWITPALTTVAQDVVEIGRACCEILMDSIKEKEKKPVKRIVKTFIVERESCKALQ